MYRFIALALLLCVGCKPATQPNSPAANPVNQPVTALTISAAASTKDVVELVVKSFEQQAGTEVKVNTGPSNGLATQIIAGAPVDLFLSASEEWASAVEKEKLAIAKTALLTNQLALVVPQGNPAKISRPEDLLGEQVKHVALAGEKVPAGTYADQALTKLMLLAPLTEAKKIVRGHDVRSTLSYVTRGEAEAGIVYVTDAAIAPSVEVVHLFDPALHDKIVYVLVLLKHAEGNQAAQQLFDFFRSDSATDIFQQHKFVLIGE